jgi:hypothetical protein
MEANQLSSTTSSRLVRPNRFVELFPDVVTSGALRSQINNSRSNGLDAAVLRKYVQPGSKRPIVLIDVPKYFEWLRGDDAKAAV